MLSNSLILLKSDILIQYYSSLLEDLTTPPQVVLGEPWVKSDIYMKDVRVQAS